ncbi:MAG: ABC transporter permease [Lachnospiraceae bacterium]|nr:ABC transporter permease [Lachnospiraceae bacterium]
MSFLSLIGIEFKKTHRSKIVFILALAVFILWLPSVLNAHMNFEMQAEGISPENNFFIQGFMGMAWFMFPASMVVGTVLLSQTEKTNRGILKMLTLPISATALCLAKFIVLLFLAALQILMAAGMYFISAAIASHTQDYPFILPLSFVFKEAGFLFLSSIPMLAFFWLLAVGIQTPIFSVGIGFASIVPSVLMINTKFWFAYPMSYPFFVITAEYGKLAESLSTAPIRLLPWLPAAFGITVFCLLLACLLFGRADRNQ